MDDQLDEGDELPNRNGEGASGPVVAAVNYPLYVVTAGTGDEVSGCLAGFVTQASIEPVRFLICISKLNHTFGTAGSSRGLGLHVLGSDQRDVASHFGELTGDEVDKFEGIAWAPGETGAPILSECAAWLEGPTVGRIDGGDHVAFLISVLDGGAGRHQGCFTWRDASHFKAGHPE